MINQAVDGQGPVFAGYYQTARLGLLRLVAGPQVQRVLELGCGAGANLSEIKKRFPTCETTGVELRAEAAHAARASAGVDHVLQGDALCADQIQFAPGSFDLVICSHVLEHFAQPEMLLARVRGWLAPGGQLLVALPNVRHLSVLVGLVWQGDFRYQPGGILDHTHLRFFTRKSAIRFLTDCGWRVEHCDADIEGAKSRHLSQWSLGWADDFAAFAYNFSLRTA
jgi:2-polyprenyl-3-methyl-5-hydroxy-6-metoxy-1,4-benzoquinol methylase